MSLSAKQHWVKFLQGVFSSSIFSYPWTYRLRNAVYSKLFNLPKTVVVLEGVKFAKLHNTSGGGAIIGEKVVLNSEVMIDLTGEIKIGSNVVLSEGAMVYSHSHEINNSARRSGTVVPSHVEIGSGTWIGAKAIIVPRKEGLTIGKSSVIGAGSVVTRDVPDNVVVAGSPARVVKELH